MDTLRALLVHLDGGRRAADRLAAAQTLAARHGAQLTALCALNPVPQALAHRHRQRARAGFERLAAAGGWPMHWEPPTEEQAIPAFTRRALHADLLVLGQRDPEDDETSTLPRDFLEAVMLGSGTPALIQPWRGRHGGSFETVLLAWQPGRASARALGAALPLLRQARRVHLLTWMADAEAARQAQHEVASHLGLHGVKALECHRGAPPADVGAGLLASADDLGAELLVMGCYGHSPTRERVLGGATLTVLREMQLPVLMAH